MNKTTRLPMLLGALLICLLCVSPDGTTWGQRPPIKIGFVTDLTGTAAQAAKDMVVTVAASDDLTQRLKYHWVIRTGWTSSQPSHAFGEYVAKTMGYRKVVVIASDYVFGWEVVGGFQKTFEESGGQVVQKLWAPLGAMDLAPYLSRIRRDADAVLTMVAGASTLQLVKQYQDAGLKSRIPLIAGGPAVDESFLPAMGDEALGIVSPLIYSAALDTPENRRFVREHRTRFGKVPSYFSETNYTSGRWINEAVKSLGGAS